MTMMMGILDCAKQLNYQKCLQPFVTVWNTLVSDFVFSK